MALKPPRDDDATPVHGVPIHEPIETIAHRTRSTATDAKNALSNINAAREELAQAIKRDEVEHKRLNDGLDSIRRDVGDLKTDVRKDVSELRKDVSELHKVAAKADGQLELLVADSKLSKETAAHREREAISDTADAKKHRRAMSLKVIAIIAGAVTALTTALTALINR